jgi:hypothetical protein
MSSRLKTQIESLVGHWIVSCLHACSRSLQSRQWRVQGTASKRAREIAFWQVSQVPNVPCLIRAIASRNQRTGEKYLTPTKNQYSQMPSHSAAAGFHASWVVAHSEVILGQVLRNPVAVEKVGFSKKSQKSGERKCLGD